MFERFAKSSSKSESKVEITLTQTEAFLQAVVGEGFRLSYGALTLAARAFGEDSSGQIPAQRGGKLVKSLRVELQPFVCRKSGRYAKGTTWDTEVPGDLRERSVITQEFVLEAVEIFRASLGSEE